MKKQCVLLVAAFWVLIAAEGLALAQTERPNRKELIDASMPEMLFGTQLRYLSGAGTLTVLLDPACDASDPALMDQRVICVLLNAGATETRFDKPDLGQVTLPGNSAKNAVLFLTSSSIDYSLANPSDSTQSAIFSPRLYVTIYSDALKDPSLVDDEGNPWNGFLGGPFQRFNTGVTYDIGKSMAPGEGFGQRFLGVARLSSYIQKTLLTISFAEGGFGIPADIVDRMYRGPITIRLGISGRGRMVGRATISFNLRVLGD